MHSTLTSANFGNKNKGDFCILDEILYEIDTHVEYPKFTFQIRNIRKFVGMNVNDF